MKYTKPQVEILGKAVRIIDFFLAKQFHLNFDAFLLSLNPTYDLDE